MATRSFISIRIPKEYEGKTLQCDVCKLPNGIIIDNGDNFAFPSVEIPISSDKNHDLYMSVYHHFDGHIESLGATLMKHYNTFESVLNLILGGDVITCMKHDRDIVEYFHKSNVSWNDNECPMFNNRIVVNELIKNSMARFHYRFEGGKWYVQKDNNKIWHLLEKQLEKI